MHCQLLIICFIFLINIIISSFIFDFTFAEEVGLEPTSRFLDHRFSRPADYQLSHPSNNFVAGGGFERSDLKVMSLVSYHCSTPQYFLVPSERLELSRLTALVPKTNVYYQFHHKGLF